VAKEEIAAMAKFFKYWSFNFMILQGMFGSIPWLVLGNNYLYTQFIGWSSDDFRPVSLMGFFGVPGGMLGGYVSDCLAERMGPKGRPFCAVLTVAMGIPILFFLYVILPPENVTILNLCIIMALFNFLATWAQPGCNFPVMSQIVTSGNRNKIICWEMAIENSMSIILGSNLPYLLGLILGYGKIEAVNGYPDVPRAYKLRVLQVIATCGPWTICFFVYIALMWSFPKDLAELEKEKALLADHTEMAEDKKGGNTADKL